MHVEGACQDPQAPARLFGNMAAAVARQIPLGGAQLLLGIVSGTLSCTTVLRLCARRAGRGVLARAQAQVQARIRARVAPVPVSAPMSTCVCVHVGAWSCPPPTGQYGVCARHRRASTACVPAGGATRRVQPSEALAACSTRRLAVLFPCWPTLATTAAPTLQSPPSAISTRTQGSAPASVAPSTLPPPLAARPHPAPCTLSASLPLNSSFPADPSAVTCRAF